MRHSPTTGSLSAKAAPFMERVEAVEPLPGARDSARNRKVNSRLSADSPAANRPMSRLPPQAPRKPPRAGPSTKPRPNAAPMRPMPRARSSGRVTSATYACAVEMLPPLAPSMTRDRKSSGSEWAKANST